MGCGQSSTLNTAAGEGSCKYRIKKNARIVILGAGPAGLHLAARLKERGCCNVRILEKTTRYGGKTHTVYKYGNPNDIGTCWMHPGYSPVIELIRKYDAGPIVEPADGLVNSRDAVMADGTRIEFGDWIFDESEDAVIPDWLQPFLPDVLQAIPVALAIKKYSKIHREIFGDYKYSLPPEPTWEGKKRIAKSFLQFLKDEGLEEILAIVLIVQTAQGYGFLEQVPAFYGLSWMTPKFVMAFLNGAVAKQPMQFGYDISIIMLLRKGFGHLWDKLVEVEKPDIRYGAQVHSIRRRGLEPGLKAPILIDAAFPCTEMNPEQRAVEFLKKDGSVPEDFFSLYPTPQMVAESVFSSVAGGDAPGMRTETIEADHLFIAAPFDVILPLMEATTTDEKEIIGALAPMTLVASLFTTPTLFRAPISSMVEGSKLTGEGRLYSARHTRGVNDPSLQPPCDGREPYICHQLFRGRLEIKDVRAAKRTMEEDLAMYGYKDVNVDKYCAFNTYLPHFSVDGVCDKRYPWRILEMQGRNNTCWVGSSACFESVLDVVNYNNLLIDEILCFV